jgi:hypothetical protein
LWLGFQECDFQNLQPSQFADCVVLRPVPANFMVGAKHSFSAMQPNVSSSLRKYFSCPLHSFVVWFWRFWWWTTEGGFAFWCRFFPERLGLA